MKSLLFLLFAVTYVTCDFTKSTADDLVRFRQECQSELEISDESIENYRKYIFTDSHAPCYLDCLFTKMNLFKDNEFLVDNLVTQLSSGADADEFKTKIQACIDDSITEKCQKAFQGFACFKKNNLYAIKHSVEKPTA